MKYDHTRYPMKHHPSFSLYHLEAVKHKLLHNPDIPILKPENNFVRSLICILVLSRMLTYSVRNKMTMVGHSRAAELEQKSIANEWAWLQMAAEIAHLLGQG